MPVSVADYKQALAMHTLETDNLLYVDTGGVLRKSTDGGATFGLPGDAPAAPESVIPAMVGGFPEGASFIVGCDQPAAASWIYLTVDFGESWQNKSGNLDTWLTGGMGGDTIQQIIAVQGRP